MRLPSDVSTSDRRARVEEVMEIFGLTPVRDSLVDKLSGGQKKRLSIAMEFIPNPSLFILDEPDSGLDGVMARELFEQLCMIAYVLSHMVFQFLLCLVQAGITMYVFSFMGVKFPEQGLLTQWMIVDIGITVFIISYASDMLSMFVSSLVHSTTTDLNVSRRRRTTMLSPW